MKLMGRCRRCKQGNIVKEPDEDPYCLACAFVDIRPDEDIVWDPKTKRYEPIALIEANETRRNRYPKWG